MKGEIVQIVKSILKNKVIDLELIYNDKHACRIYTYYKRGNPVNIEIDLEIVPLIETLWSLGVETYYSCQGDKKVTQKHFLPDGNPCEVPEIALFGYISLSTKGFEILQNLPNFSEIEKYLERVEENAKTAKNPSSVVIRFKNENIRKITNLVEKSEVTAKPQFSVGDWVKIKPGNFENLDANHPDRAKFWRGKHKIVEISRMFATFKYPKRLKTASKTFYIDWESLEKVND